MHNMLNRLEEVTLNELRTLSEQGHLSPTECCTAKEGLEVLLKIEELRMVHEGGESHRNSYGMMQPHHVPYEQWSGARHRDSMGRFTSHDGGEMDGYSERRRRSYSDGTVEGLERLMGRMDNEADRQVIRDAMSHMNR